MLQRTLYKKQNIDLSSAPWTMHEFFAGSGLVAYGLKGMFAPIWANDISEQKAAVYEANFGCEHFELGDIKDVNEKLEEEERAAVVEKAKGFAFCSFILGQFSMPGFVFGWFFRRYSRIQKRIGVGMATCVG